MPRLSDSMESGTIVRWLKQDGDRVSRGEPLAEVETDKATVTFDADADGTLRILVGEGETVAIGKPIAQIGDAATPEQTPARVDNGRAKASPLARRIARESGVDLSRLIGSGPGGRIVKSDVTAAAKPAISAEPPLSRPAGNKGEVTIRQPTRTQVQIAQRMSESRATIPSFALQADVDMDLAVTMRAQLRQAARSGDVIPSYNDMVVKACAIALRDHPRANAAYRDGVFECYDRVNGVASFEAIINPPQAAILAVGELRELPVVRGGQVVPGSRMSTVLSCDHRILYGAPAAEFLARIRQLLEQPVNLLL